jgi:hypothetical protein
MNANELTNSGIVTQLAMVHTMLPKIKELIDQQQEQIDKLTAIVALREMDIAVLKQTIDANNLSQNIGQFVKPAKYTDEWWKEVAEFNKMLKEQNEQ